MTTEVKECQTCRHWWGPSKSSPNDLCEELAKVIRVDMVDDGFLQVYTGPDFGCNKWAGISNWMGNDNDQS